MGRDKPKKYNKMGYQQQSVYHDKQADKYNINKDDFTDSNAGGRWENFDEGGYKKAIKNAMRNDFDYRTSAQHMDGVKGQANFNDFTKYEREAVKLHRQAGNEGEYSSNKDITNVTNNLVRDDRSAQADMLDEVSNDINGLRQQIEANRDVEDQATADPQSFEHSDAVSKAQDNLEKYKLNIGNDGLFSKSNGSVPRADDQADATASFANKYKSDVKEASNLGEAVASNLNNAINTVKSYRS
jgi:hypothetical protein